MSLTPATCVEQGAGQVLRAADSDRAVIELPRSLLGVGDHFRERLHRQLGARHDHDREDADQRDGLEILRAIESELSIERLVDRDRSGAGGHQCVAVRGGFGGGEGAGVAARTRAIVDDEGLPDRLAHTVEQDARDDVARAAAGERDDDRDRPGGIGLGVGGRAGEDRRKNADRAQRNSALPISVHACSFPLQSVELFRALLRYRPIRIRSQYPSRGTAFSGICREVCVARIGEARAHIAVPCWTAAVVTAAWLRSGSYSPAMSMRRKSLPTGDFGIASTKT